MSVGLNEVYAVTECTQPGYAISQFDKTQLPRSARDAPSALGLIQDWGLLQAITRTNYSIAGSAHTNQLSTRERHDNHE